MDETIRKLERDYYSSKTAKTALALVASYIRAGVSPNKSARICLQFDACKDYFSLLYSQLLEQWKLNPVRENLVILLQLHRKFGPKPKSRIFSTFFPQYDAPRNYIYDDHENEHYGARSDVTDKILEMEIEDILDIKDNADNSDELVSEELLSIHDGPWRVEIENSLRKYFSEVLQGESYN